MAENPRGEEVNAEIAAEEANKLSDLLPGPGDVPVPQVPNVAPTMPGMPPIDPQALQDGVQNATQAIQQGIQNAQQQQTFGQQAQEVGSELGTAVVGGTADAAESVGSVLDLGGDTVRKGLNELFGKPTATTDDPFSEEYVPGTWLDIPDDWVPENKTAYGKIARGFVEFGVLAATTKGVGKALTGAAGITRAANVAHKGNRWIQFAAISAEGSAADFIQRGGYKEGQDAFYEENLMNLFQDHAPGMAPWLVNALAVNEGDNEYLERLKTVFIGAGFNHVAHGIGGFIKGKQAARAAKAAKMPDYEIDRVGNEAMDSYINAQQALDEATGLQNAADNFTAGKGTSRSRYRTEYLAKHLSEDEFKNYNTPGMSDVYRNQMDNVANNRGNAAGDVWDDINRTSPSQEAANAGRTPDPFVNPERFDSYDKGTIPNNGKDAARKHLLGAIEDSKNGGDGRSYTPYATESAIKAMSAGSKTYREWVKETLDDITDAAFKGLDDALSWREVQDLIIKKSQPILEDIHAYADGKKVDLNALFKKQLDDPKNYRVYSDEGNVIKTITPVQKGVNIIGIHALTRLASDIATGAIHISDGLPIGRQMDMILEASKRAMIENKKLSLMWSLDGQAQSAGFKLTTPLKKAYTEGLENITKEMNEYFDWLHELSKSGNHDLRQKIAILHQMSDGKIRNMNQLHEWLRATVWGGRMDAENIPGRIWEEGVGAMYNSILSAPITPIKAITSTNLYAISRPLVTALAAQMPWHHNPKEALIAAAQIDAIGRSFSESLKMFKYNIDLGNARKSQSYTGKFDLQNNLSDWQSKLPYIEQFGDDNLKLAASFTNFWVNMNNSPLMAYSRIWMGAGDAAARTFSGRFRMASKTARDLLDQGVDPEDLNAFVRKYEEGYRNQIFKKDKYGQFVVHEKAAKRAGDKASLTQDLEGRVAALQGLQKIPFMRNFFTFMRTGVGAIGRDFVENTPFARMQNKWKDLVEANPPRNLELYGLTPEEVDAEVLMMKGNLEVAKAIVGITALATLTGRYRGDMPLDKEERALWKMRKIQPNSFNIGGVQFGIKRMEMYQPVMNMTANAVSNMGMLGEDIFDRTLQKATWVATTIITDTTMLSGVEDLAAILDPETNVKPLDYTLARVTRAHLPFTGFSGSLGNIYDASAKEAQNFWQLLGRRDVFLKSFVPNKYDVVGKDRSGKTMTYGPENTILRAFNQISPITITPIDNDPVKKMLHDMRYDMPEALSKMNEEPLNALEKSAMERQMSMDKQFRAELERVANPYNEFYKSFQEYKKGGFKIHESAVRQGLPLGNKHKEGWKLQDQEWYIEIDRIFSAAKQRAKENVLREHPDLRDRITIRTHKKLYGKSGSYGAAETRLPEIEKLMNIPK